MNESTNTPLTSDEKIMAGLAHLFGVIAALLVWAFQKDKSRFAKFQALQALTFDFVVMVVLGVLFFCGFGLVFILGFGSMFTMLNNASSPEELGPFFAFPFMFPFLIFACVTPISLLLTIVRIIAAVSVLNGKDFHYPLLGNWLERFLEKPG